MKAQPMTIAPKDGSDILLKIRDRWVQGHWQACSFYDVESGGLIEGEDGYWKVLDCDDNVNGYSEDAPQAWCALPSD